MNYRHMCDDMRVYDARQRGRRAGSCAAGGVTLIELVIVMGIILMVVGMLVMMTSRVRASAQSTTCLSNLRQIGQAFLTYATNHGGRLPDPLAAGQPWEMALAPILGTDNVFVCPADGEIQAMLGSSYDWRDTGDPSTTLAGRMIHTITRNDLVVAFDSLPGWHAEGKMNAIMWGGDARIMDVRECLADVMAPVQLKQNVSHKNNTGHLNRSNQLLP